MTGQPSPPGQDRKAPADRRPGWVPPGPREEPAAPGPDWLRVLLRSGAPAPR